MSTKCNKRANYRQHRRIRKGKYGIMTLILLFFIITTGYFLLYTDFFLIEEIEISGASYIDKNEIIRISNLEVGMNIFKFNKDKVKKQVNNHSFIKDTEIKRQYPNKVTIIVIEREVASIIPFEDGRFIYIDEDGFVMQNSGSLNTYNSPLLTGIENVSFIVGNAINIKPSWLGDSIIEIISNLKENNLMKEISEIHVLEDYNIQIYTIGGSVINIGDSNMLEKKMSFIESYLSQPHPKEIIDISHGGDPVSRPRAN